MSNIKIDSKKISINITVDSKNQIEYRVMLIVDSKPNREMILRSLLDCKSEIVEFTDFEQMALLISKRSLDLVVIDNDSGQVNSMEFIRMLHERHLKVPILLLLAGENSKTKQEALRHGVFDFIKKPLDSVNIDSMVQLAFQNGKAFISKMSPDIFEINSHEKVELSLDKKVLVQIDRICSDMKISRETFLQKAIQKVLTKDERTTSPSAFWNSQIVTGVGWIDDQHYLLLNQIQEIYNLYSDGIEKTKIAEIFKFLKHYVDVHFKQEEQMFYLLSDAEKKMHFEQHNHFQVKILELNLELQSESNNDALLKLVLYCQKWFINHIQQIDQSLVKKIKALNLSELEEFGKAV
jgi:hemerythrin-like metal-binding protein